MHLQVHPTLSQLSQLEPARCLQQTDNVIVLNKEEDMLDCLVACGKISLWLSHTVAHTAYMSSLLSALLQWGQCPVYARFVCVRVFAHVCHE